jgi:Tfp pilus assembly protein PilP
MRLAKTLGTLMALLALLAWAALPLHAESQPPAKPPQQKSLPAKTSPQAGKQSAPAPSPAASQAKTPAQAPSKAAAAPAGKASAPAAKAQAPAHATKVPAQAAKAPSKPAVAVKGAKAAKVSKPPKVMPAKVAQPVKMSRRDPFSPLVGKEPAGGALPERLPPGKAGLVVSTLRLDGIVRGPNGMIAVVSNPQQRVYFLRENDQLYDGRVEKISMDAVSFHETGKDAFGKPVERQVTKRLYPSAGEQR